MGQRANRGRERGDTRSREHDRSGSHPDGYRNRSNDGKRRWEGDFRPAYGDGNREWDPQYGARGFTQPDGYRDERVEWRDQHEAAQHQGAVDARHDRGRWGESTRFSGRGPKGYRRSDERITEEINETLTRHGDLDPSEIEVRVSNGEVTLTGTVASRRDKRLAEDLAERASGVQDVMNQLRVARDEAPTETEGGRPTASGKTAGSR